VSLARPRPDRRTLLRVGVVANTLVAAALAYLIFTDVTLGAPRYAVYGLLWVGVGAAAAWTTRVGPADAAVRRRAALVGLVYFGALAVAGGVVVPAPPAQTPDGLRVAFLPPGWGPALIYSGSLVNLVLMPARVVGYLSLAYLVYATVVDALSVADGTLRGTVPGLLGLLSCVSCSWPILASIFTGVFGAGSAVAGTALTFSYDISTLVYVVTVLLLYWRPFVGR
jgi:hypothetical protein